MLSVSAVALNPEDAKPAQTWRKIGMLHHSTFVDSVEFLRSGHEPAYSSWQPSLGNLVAQGLGLPRPKQRVARRIQVQLRLWRSSQSQAIDCTCMSNIFGSALHPDIAILARVGH